MYVYIYIYIYTHAYAIHIYIYICESPQYLSVILRGKMVVCANLRNSPQNLHGSIARRHAKILARETP